MILDGGANIFRRAGISNSCAIRKNFRLIRVNIHPSQKGKRLSNLQNQSPQNPDSLQEKNTMTRGLETAQRQRSVELMKVA